MWESFCKTPGTCLAGGWPSMKWSGLTQEVFWYSLCPATAFADRWEPSKMWTFRDITYQVNCDCYKVTRNTSKIWAVSPRKNKGYASVGLGNLLCFRVVLLAMYAACRGVRYIIEQPTGSALDVQPAFRKFCEWSEAGQAKVRFFSLHLISWLYKLLFAPGVV